MPMIVVGGSGRNVGKTALICGLIAALPEFHWIAVKITSHAHGIPAPIWEEREPEQGSDTARYLAAGARRAFLIAADEAEVPVLVRELQEEIGAEADLIFESNRIVEWLRPDLCLAVKGLDEGEAKTSFEPLLRRADATVKRGVRDEMISGDRPQFLLRDLTQLSIEMRRWLLERGLRERLA